jgi:hypothetical protein
MQTFTTKAFSGLPDADDFRSNGPGVDAMVLRNESVTIELEATLDEVETASEELELEIDSNVIPDEVMSSLIEHLNKSRMLGQSYNYQSIMSMNRVSVSVSSGL